MVQTTSGLKHSQMGYVHAKGLGTSAHDYWASGVLSGLSMPHTLINIVESLILKTEKHC